MSMNEYNELIDYFKQLLNKVVHDATILTISIIIMLLVLSLIFTWLEWKEKWNR